MGTPEIMARAMITCLPLSGVGGWNHMAMTIKKKPASSRNPSSAHIAPLVVLAGISLLYSDKVARTQKPAKPLAER